jgi:phytoene dehydrogenase-like protein
MANGKTDIIIIGAGISGLCTGCYGQMNNYTTQIFEMHDKPGGVCTSWKRQGYIVDGCLHSVLGVAPGTSFYHMWQEMGVIQGRHFVHPDQLARIEGPDNQVLNFYTDLDRLEQHLKELAPSDAKVITEFIKNARICTRYDLPVDKAFELFTLGDGIKLVIKFLPLVLRVFRKWSRVSLHDFAQRFSNSFLREAFPLVSGLPDLPIASLLMLLAWSHRRVTGYPVGGSLELARAIEKRYLGLGGRTNYRSRVTKILVENNVAVGIRLDDGTEYRGEIIISAADGHSTIFDLLEGKYLDEKTKGHYEELPLFHPIIHIALGVARSFDEIPPLVTGLNFPIGESVTIGGQAIRRLTMHIYNFDPTLAPEKRTLITVLIPTDYDYWKDLSHDPKRYHAEKKGVGELVTSLVEQRFPGITTQVEMCNVATPITFERYTGNWRGSFEGWEMSTKTFGLRMSKRLPGLSNFYMVGQWVEPGGGLPPAVMSARHVVQVICRKSRRHFITSKPRD